ncbi:MAG: phasin family protein [Mesorhizobium sp.]
MSKNFEDVGALGKEFYEGGLKAFTAFSTGAQAIAVETSDYAKKAIEDGVSAWQSITAAKSFEKAVEIQSSYLKSSYEGFVAEASKLSGLYADLAKDAYQPFEAALAKAK